MLAQQTTDLLHRLKLPVMAEALEEQRRMPDAVSLDEDTVPIGAYEATNGLGDLGYTGPCPAAGSEHLYLISVHYLGVATGLLDGVPGDELFASIATAEVATAEVTGTFSRAGG